MQVPHRGPMIYLLIEDSKGFDDCDRPIFAHANKATVEDALKRMEGRHQHLKKAVIKLQEVLDKIYAENPLPEEPNLKKLPPRELIWNGWAWANAYMIEWQEEYKKNRDKVSQLSNDLIKAFGQFLSISEKDLEDIFHHTDDITYSINEIEDDPTKL